MAFLPSYKHDIFISYAVVDNARGWVTTLVNELKIELAGWLGRMDSCDIWWDRTNLDEADSLDRQIGSTLQDTAILIAILSPAYMASHWCEQERKHFLEVIRQRQLAGKRTFLVDLGRLDVEDRPPEFADYLGFNFWERDELGKRQTLGFPVPVAANAEHKDFYEKVKDLAEDISNRLKELHESESEAGGGADDDGRQLVFLAEVGEDLERQRQQVIQYLEQHDFRVLPRDPFPVAVDDCRAAINGHLGTCDVFAQLLDSRRGRRLSGTDQRLVALQHELAEAAGKTILQWRDRGLDLSAIVDDDHRSLVNGQHVMTGPLDLFKSEIVKLATPVPDEEPLKVEGIPYIYINNGLEDVEVAADLSQMLQGLGCMCEYHAGGNENALTPSKFREEQRRQLLECDGVIYLYGKIGRSWVMEQFRRLRKLVPKRGRDLGIAVCECPPGHQPPLGMGFPKLQVLNCRDGLARDPVRDFLSSIPTEPAQ